MILSGSYGGTRTSLFELCQSVRLVVDVGDNVEYVYASDVTKSDVWSFVNLLGFSIIGRFECNGYFGKRVVRVDVLDANGDIVFSTDAGGLVIDRNVLTLNLRVACVVGV